MGNCVTGNSRESRTMHYYDQLPRSARLALQDARFPWATRSFLKSFESGQLTAKELVKRIKLIDREIALKERAKVWGPDYPVEVL